MQEKRRDYDELEKAMQNLIQEVEAEELLTAPVHMKQEILERSRRMDRPLTNQVRQTSKNLQLFFYSLKVGAAVAAALVLLFAVPQDFLLDQWITELVNIEQYQIFGG